MVHPFYAMAGRDILAILVAISGAAGLVIYLVATGAFKSKILRIDPSKVKMPKEVKVEHWYTRLARSWDRILFDSGWRYAKAKKRARVTFKKGYREMKKTAREKVPGAIRRMNRDIAVGALIITITLVAFLLIKLL